MIQARQCCLANCLPSKSTPKIPSPADSSSRQPRLDRGKIGEADKYDGKGVLETNDYTISLEWLPGADDHRALLSFDEAHTDQNDAHVSRGAAIH